MRPSYYPVIMCGGSGTRLWPLSRPSRPKQFIPLVEELSTFGRTLRRVAGLCGPSVLVVAGLAHLDCLLAEAATAGVAVEILLEPEARESAAAIAAAAAWISRRDPDGIAVVVAADHHIPDDQAFLASIEAASAAVETQRIVTLGVSPSFASTAYGYIQAGEASPGMEPARPVAAFVEKPDLVRADDYVKRGFLWNSGNFIASAQVLLGELDRFAPQISAAARRAVDQATPHRGASLLGAAFAEAPKTSIDYAVMERTERAAVIPVSFEWSDLGAWDAVWRASLHDDHGNAAPAGCWLDEASGCVVRAPSSLQVALVGVRDLAVVCDGDSLLVCGLEASQRVKQAADALKLKIGKPAEGELTDLADYSRRLVHWLKAAALPLWATMGADHVGGGFHESVSLDGEPLAEPRRARVQARQVFTYARAARDGYPGPWLSTARHGYDDFILRYRRGDGLFRTLVSAQGDALDQTAFLYDQAFALIAMAALWEADPGRTDLAGDAAALLQAIKRTFGCSDGAYREQGRHPYQANALMHLFEAAQAWRRLSDDPVWDNLATELATHALERLYDPQLGVIREVFDESWRAADGSDGRLVEPGHQFEWAWLLCERAQIRPAPRTVETARALFQAGLKGFDAQRGVVVDELDAHGGVRRGRARLWPQTEFLKSALCLAAMVPSEADPFEAHARSAAGALCKYLETPTLGLWRDKLGIDDVFEVEPAPASSFYHIIGAILALRSYVDKQMVDKQAA